MQARMGMHGVVYVARVVDLVARLGAVDVDVGGQHHWQDHCDQRAEAVLRRPTICYESARSNQPEQNCAGWSQIAGVLTKIVQKKKTRERSSGLSVSSGPSASYGI